jgi:hypothetical protein
VTTAVSPRLLKVRLGLTAASLVISACSSGPDDPVGKALAELEAAAEAKDADRFAARLGEGFRGEGAGSGSLGKVDAIASLRRYFAAYESVSLTVHEPEVETREQGARVRCAVEFSGKANAALGLGGLLPKGAVYHFELDLSDEAGIWRVQRATWEWATPPPG